MDWTFWLGAGVLVVAWVSPNGRCPSDRFARKVRHLDPEQAEAIMEAEEYRRELKCWFR